MASDLRGSAALVLAGLVADGRDRRSIASITSTGATNSIDAKLRALGARVERLSA